MLPETPESKFHVWRRLLDLPPVVAGVQLVIAALGVLVAVPGATATHLEGAWKIGFFLSIFVIVAATLSVFLYGSRKIPKWRFRLLLEDLQEELRNSLERIQGEQLRDRGMFPYMYPTGRYAELRLALLREGGENAVRQPIEQAYRMVEMLNNLKGAEGILNPDRGFTPITAPIGYDMNMTVQAINAGLGAITSRLSTLPAPPRY